MAIIRPIWANNLDQVAQHIRELLQVTRKLL
jgi:hypothetical protein